MTAMETFGKIWLCGNAGEVRCYVDDCWQYAGLKVERCDNGDICNAVYRGEKISNSEAERMISSIKDCWITEDGKIHMHGHSRDEYADFRREVKEGIKARLAE